MLFSRQDSSISKEKKGRGLHGNQYLRNKKICVASVKVYVAANIITYLYIRIGASIHPINLRKN